MIDRADPEYHPAIVVIAWRTLDDGARLLLLRRKTLPRWGTTLAGRELAEEGLPDLEKTITWSEHDAARKAFDEVPGAKPERGSLLVAFGPLTDVKLAAAAAKQDTITAEDEKAARLATADAVAVDAVDAAVVEKG